MFTQPLDQVDTTDAAPRFPLLDKIAHAYEAYQARRTLARSNKLFEKVEEQKYRLTQRHREAVSVLYNTAKGPLVDQQFFATMNAVEAIQQTGQSLEQQLEHQRIALQYGMRAIKDIIDGRRRTDD
ncbi:hypothetical protein [Massilia suwonensis]|uniref:Phasin domain-containing protein n=1 Tax=Massilia suwonensis TaxID=648895 RepID=A0ABW0MGI3_9BURK